MKYLILSIIIILGLIILFFVSYVLNKKTPLPKGCEDIRISNENCLGCNNEDCKIKNELLSNIEEVKDELKEEEKWK
ncbi:MAG: hypothetical protein ACI35S_08670 [Anaeroplasma sp.]